jgi:hypothetical protein
MNEKEKAELQAAVQEYHKAQTLAAAAPLPQLTQPPELLSPDTPPALRAVIREQYCAALMDRRPETWSASDRKLMGEHLAVVMRGLGF